MASGPPAPIVKTYPPRGPLSQFRLERATPFACFRCGQEKKAKLVTVYADDWSRVLCNGCYGCLLSIHEIAAGTATEDEKADQLAVVLLQLVYDDDARTALRRSTYRQSPEACLSSETARFLGTAEFVADRLQGHDTLEWSPAIIGLCKAAELEVVARLLEPLRQRCATVDLSGDLADKDLQRLARWCAGSQHSPPELGSVRHVLVTAANSKRRASSSPLLRAFLELARAWPRGAWVLASDGLASELAELTTRFRNPAAHTETLDAADYLACRDLVAGDTGLLWRLVDVTG